VSAVKNIRAPRQQVCLHQTHHKPGPPAALQVAQQGRVPLKNIHVNFGLSDVLRHVGIHHARPADTQHKVLHFAFEIDYQVQNSTPVMIRYGKVSCS
jgi:hypothetical protein